LIYIQLFRILEKLQNIIEELNINASLQQKTIDSLQIQNLQLQKEKNYLEQVAEENRKEINELKKAKSSLGDTVNKNTSVSSNQTNIKPRASSIGNSLNENFDKAGNDSINNLNSSSYVNVTSTSLNKRVSTTVKTNTTSSTQSPYTFRSSLNQASTNQTQTTQITVAPPAENNNLISTVKVINTRRSVIASVNEPANILKKQDIAKDFNEKKSHIEDVIFKPFIFQKRKTG